jgi:DNA mismatch endonuclease (patch repair protein)
VLKRPAASSDVIRERMQRQSRRDTVPELALRRAVWKRGLRYRVDVSPMRGARRRADLLFTRAKVAVYVDGCFWHSCPQHATTPKANRAWWIEKLHANVARDRDTDRQLHESGWIALRIWEHEDTDTAAARVERLVRARIAEVGGRSTPQSIPCRGLTAR